MRLRSAISGLECDGINRVHRLGIADELNARSGDVGASTLPTRQVQGPTCSLSLTQHGKHLRVFGGLYPKSHSFFYRAIRSSVGEAQADGPILGELHVSFARDRAISYGCGQFRCRHVGNIRIEEIMRLTMATEIAMEARSRESDCVF